VPRGHSEDQPEGSGAHCCRLWLAVRPGRPLDQETLVTLTMSEAIEQMDRQKRLNEWYEKDGRHDKSHPFHSLYTGLAEKYMNKEEVQENA